MNESFSEGAAFARKLDQQDPLKDFRNKFVIPGPSLIYLDGNSLGRLALASSDQICDTTNREWGADLIESWNKSWYNKPLELGNKIAKLIGASENEVLVCDSTSVNLYKLAFAALKSCPGKTQVVSDTFNFPTDLYILQGILKDMGDKSELLLAGSKDDITIEMADLESKIDNHTALVVLSHVAFKSSYKYNIKKVTQLAHKNGALVLWDLSHSAGVAEILLNEWNVDLAVGCTYKFMNGGPGSPAYLYVRKDLQKKLNSPIQGWFGDKNPFSFDTKYQPAKGIKKFLAGTPPVLSLMSIEPAIDILLEAGIKNIQQKSRMQTEYLLYLIKMVLIQEGFKIGSPADAETRGSHISLRHPEALRICQALIHPAKGKKKIIPDFREPDNIRLGIAPLYNSFYEIYETVLRLKEVVTKKEFTKIPFIRGDVT